MPQCQERFYRWGRPANAKRRLTKGWGARSSVGTGVLEEWPVREKEHTELAQHLRRWLSTDESVEWGLSAPTSQSQSQLTFRKLADQWLRETMYSSSSEEIVLHPAYQSIIAMGPTAIPLVMAELASQRGHWFWALRFLTGSDPVPEGSNIVDARDAWLVWGRQHGYLE